MNGIVIGYDGSESAQRALERTAELAKGAAEATVVDAVYVAPRVGRAPLYIDPSDVSETRRHLAEAKAFLLGSVSTKVVHDACDVLVVR